jgi:Flp pilus assembly protein TadD
VCRALALDPSRPEAANLLGVLEDLTGRPMQAQKYYRVALELDPRYQAARENLERSTTLGEGRGRIQVG